MGVEVDSASRSFVVHLVSIPFGSFFFVLVWSLARACSLVFLFTTLLSFFVATLSYTPFSSTLLLRFERGEESARR